MIDWAAHSLNEKKKANNMFFIILLFVLGVSCLEKRDFIPTGTYNYTTTLCALDVGCSACTQMFFGQRLKIDFNASNFFIANQGLGYDSISGTISNNPFPIPSVQASVNIGQIQFPCNGSLDVGGNVLSLTCNYGTCIARIEYTCLLPCPTFFSVTTQNPNPPTTENPTSTTTQNPTNQNPATSTTDSVDSSLTIDVQAPNIDTNLNNSLLGLFGLFGIIPFLCIIFLIVYLPRKLKQIARGPAEFYGKGEDIETKAFGGSMLELAQNPDLWIHQKDIEIQESIGSGNFGQVFRAKWNGNEVALKSVSSHDKTSIAQEASILKSLQHPNIITFYGLLTCDNNFYMVIEYLSKGDLGKYLAINKESLQVSDLENMSLQVLRGMCYLESKKVLHRDLAARNILVTLNDTRVVLKIADFGLGRKMEANPIYTSSQQTAVPIRWAAPEVIMSSTYSPASEVWSFAIVLWEIFSFAELPYQGLSNAEVIEKVKEGFRLSSPENCPSWIDSIIQSCWNSDPSKRPDFTSILKEFESKQNPILPIPSDPHYIEYQKDDNEPVYFSQIQS